MLARYTWNTANLVSGLLGSAIGASATLISYKWNEAEIRVQRTINTKREYGQNVQDGLAFLGAQRKYLKAHGVSLEAFMRDFPRQQEFPGQFNGPNGEKYLSLQLWLEVRSACHRLNSYWDSFLEDSPEHKGDRDAAGNAGDLKLNGRWANRARNFCEMVEPLEEANFTFMEARGQYEKPSRFRRLEDAITKTDGKTQN